MKFIAAIFRLAIAMLGIVAIVSTFVDTSTRAAINPFNFFGYFTMQSNIFIVFFLLLAALVTFTGKTQPQWLMVARGCATTYIVITGVVYNILLNGLEGGISLAWANTVLHLVLPLYAAFDWVVFSDRGPLAWKRIWLVLIYPIVWIIVVLARGATDGWVPYPFLDPAQGYGVVAMYALGIAAATVVFAILIWAISRVHLIRSLKVG